MTDIVTDVVSHGFYESAWQAAKNKLRLLLLSQPLEWHKIMALSSHRSRVKPQITLQFILRMQIANVFTQNQIQNCTQLAPGGEPSHRVKNSNALWWAGAIWARRRLRLIQGFLDAIISINELSIIVHYN